MANLSLFDLNDRVAIVTGSTKGIGKALALGLAGAGANVVIVGRTVADVEAMVQQVKSTAGKAIGIPGDVTVRSQVDAMVKKTLDTFGRIDILVNNVGGGAYAPVLEMEEDAWDAMIDLNLKSVYLCCRAVGRVMVQQKKGSIINLSSGAAVWPSGDTAHYSAAKAGVQAFSQALAKQWGRHNIRVNILMPGITETSLTKRFYADRPEVLRDQLSRIPLGRLGQPEDYVGAAIFLASDASAYITGSLLIARGGAM